MTQPTLTDLVRRALERDALMPSGSRVLVAVSGGSDSVALLELLVELAPACGFTVAGVAHLNHGLRGRASDGDEAFCRRLARTHGLPVAVERRDVAALARQRSESIEAAARHARYAFFAAAASTLHADRVATGHTRDDQAETFLLRLLRGAGAQGLAGIPSQRDAIVRPLLDTRRRDLRAYLASRGRRFREDASNRDLSIPRNWVRHRLLPLLDRQLRGDVVEVLARESAILRDEGALVDGLARAAAAAVVSASRDGRLRLDAAALDRAPTAVARRVVRQALAQAAPGRFHGFDHVEQVLRFCRCTQNSRAMDLPGVRVERNRGNVVLVSRGARRLPAGPGPFSYELPVPGRVRVAEAGHEVSAAVRRVRAPQTAVKQALAAGPSVAVIDAAAIVGGLRVRSRRPGDALRPFGMAGRRKKLQDVLVDAKVPRDARDRVALVVDARERILWVAGLVVSEDARVTGQTQSVVTLKLSGFSEEGDEA